MLNEIPTITKNGILYSDFNPLTLDEEKTIMKKLKLSFYDEVDAPKKQEYLNYYFEVFPDFYQKYIVASKEEKETMIKNEINKSLKYRSEFIYNNQRLIIYLAKKYMSTCQLEDLVQQGNIGMIVALKKFDLKKDIKFSTYGTLCIKEAIARYAMNNYQTIRVPISTQKKIVSIKKAKEELTEKLGRTPTIEELEKETNITKEMIKAIENYINYEENPVSIDTPIYIGSDETLKNYIRYDEQPFTTEVENKIMIEQLKRTLSEINIDETNTKILTMRYGLDGNEPKSFDEIGDILGITAHNARNKLFKTLIKLRNNPQIIKITNISANKTVKIFKRKPSTTNDKPNPQKNYETILRIKTIIALLNPIQKKIITMIYKDKLTYEEINYITGIKIKKIKLIEKEALKYIKNELKSGKQKTLKI